MTNQNTFMEILKDVTEIIRTSETPVSEKEILTYFDGMELTEEQKKMILDYLRNAEQEVEDGQTGIDAASENSKVLKAYMEDISLIKKHSEKEALDLYERLLSGSNEVIEQISEIWLKKVVDIADGYKDMHARVEDLIQEGNIAVLLKLNELCGIRGNSDMKAEDVENELSGAAEEGIMNYISEWNGEKEKENALVGKLSLVHEAKSLLQEENGEIPTLEELSDYTKISVDELSGLSGFVKDNS